jgi:hypothetical protein
VSFGRTWILFPLGSSHKTGATSDTGPESPESLDYIIAVYIVKGETQTVTCTTDSSRHADWMQRYAYHYLCYSTGDNSVNHSSW